MSQPPSQQPPGGFGAPQDRQPDPRQWTPPDQPQDQPPDQPSDPRVDPRQNPWAADPAPEQRADPRYGGPHIPPQDARPPVMPPYQGPPQTPPQPQPYPQSEPYPQSPPPGYGYPQQQPQPAYGYQQQYPQQQPGPYGQQPPAPQLGYQWQDQGQPPYSTPPGGGTGGGGGFFKRKPAVVIGAATAALLVIGAGTYFVVSEGDSGGSRKKNVSKSDGPGPADPASEGPASGTDPEKEDPGAEAGERPDGDGDGELNAGRQNGEAKIAFVTTNDVDLPRNGVDAFGPWVAGDTVVRAMYKRIVGYSAADGKKKWTVPVDTEICSATLEPSPDGKIVVGVKDGHTERAECLDLRMIDLKTGKPGWKKTLRTGEGFNALTDFTLTISGDTLGAAGLGNSFGFSMADGRQLFKGPVSGCKPFAFAGGPKLLAATQCPTTDWNKPKHQLQEIDPATGRAKWTYKAPEGWEVEKVFSADPIVVSLKQSKEKKWGVVALNANGTERSRIQGGKDKFQPRCGGSFVVLGENLEGCIGVAADADALYMATQSARPGGANEVVAFDLDSGRPTWRTPSGGDSTIMPLRMEGGNVLAYREPTWDKGGMLATISPSGGAPKALLKLQDATAQEESTFYSSRMVYDGGRFFIASGRVSARNDAEEMRTRTMMAFTK
ncbi:hypothetical protein GCM10010387_16990 [Streptomyces inusitatus]|uniref:Pyrrolo-quinoline quinone repeat domain-containing protein n=1 Tax=Streptomyces inusitatus TaxID=68221 RepID=A0A918PXN4_9ACTN|nr:PQQ-binding-like beta-propeller repeat protein [Streptomyces inusitatus]GGZ24256.1 hypothetical protein GCM10010387_16990 [Streptomyces inusitatus]